MNKDKRFIAIKRFFDEAENNTVFAKKIISLQDMIIGIVFLYTNKETNKSRELFIPILEAVEVKTDEQKAKDFIKYELEKCPRCGKTSIIHEQYH